MDYPCLYDGLMQLYLAERNCQLTSSLNNRIWILEQDVRFLRTYLLCMEVSKEASIISFGRSNSLISSIEAVVLEASGDLRSALSGTRTTENLAYVLHSIENKVEHFEPKIKEDYIILSNQHLWQSSRSYSSLRPVSLQNFCDFVIRNLNYLVESKSMILSLKKQMEVLVKKLEFLKNLICDTFLGEAARQTMASFLLHVLFVANGAARLSYLCWFGKMDETKAGEMEIMLSDLLQKIKPDPEFMEMHVELLKPSTLTRPGDGEIALSFVNFLIENSISFMNDETIVIREEMVFLVKFVINLQIDQLRGDSKRISADIKAMAREAGTFEYNFIVNEVTEGQIREMNHVFSMLLVKMKLIKAEIYLVQLQDSHGSLIAPFNDRMLALHEGLKFLITFLGDPLEEKTQDKDELRKHVGTMPDEVMSLIHSIHEKKMTQERIREVNLALFALVVKIKYIPGELYLMGLKDLKAEFMVPINDQIVTLHEGLKYLTAFLMDTSKMGEDTEDGKLFLKHFEAVTRESSSFILSLCTNEIANEAIDEANLKLFKLVEKINFVKSEIFLVELLSREVGWVVHMKDQVQTLQKGVRFLRTVLMDPPKEFKEIGKLICMKIEALATEATSLVFLFYDNVMKEDMSKEMNLLMSMLIEKIMLLKAEIGLIYLQIPRSYPKTDELGFITSLLRKLREFLRYNSNSIASAKHHLDMVRVDLEFLKSFLIKSVKQHNEHEELKVLWTCITKVAYELEYAVDSFVVGDSPLCIRMLWLSAVMEEIKLIKARVMEISKEKRFDSEFDSVAKSSSDMQSQASTSAVDEVVIGFETAAEDIIYRLTRGTMERDIVPIVGMPGLGKTTLAKEVYNNPSVANYFYVRAWCCVSQVYQRRQLLLDILSQITQITDQIHGMDVYDIAEELYRHLKGRRYLIVMDDLWNIGAWNDLSDSFPNDRNGSRVLFTSRFHDVALKAKPDCKPYRLRLLSSIESWKLLEAKLFHEEGCPPSLQEVGKEIARNCKGLPLSVVVIAGLLATEKTPHSWEQVLKSLSSHIFADPQRRCQHVLELSYKNLPDNLKACFLYFGSFPEDNEIPISKLLRLWIAEGFLHETDGKSLENAAEICLLDLIGRSLIIVAKTRSDGRVKSCRVHDLLRKLCQNKAAEEHFSQLVHGYDERVATSPDGMDYFSTDPLTYKQRRLCICSQRKHFTMLRPCGPRVHSLRFLASNDLYPRLSYDISFIPQNFKLLRVLDLESINMGRSFPTGLELLVQLRYLAVRGDVISVPTSIANLCNLETFLVKGLRGEVTIPDSFWNMERLRHVHINDRAAFSLQDNKLGNQSLLDNLYSLSTVALPSGKVTEKMMRRLLKLRKLRCIFVESWDYFKKCHMFPMLEFLTHLESLKIFYYGSDAYPCQFNFPANLKRLTLSKFRLPWSEISTIGRLPNLEVLKLLFKAFEGQIWETGEGEFQNLKYLKLDNLDIACWKPSNDNFPSLKQLVLQGCKKLVEVPLSFGEIPTLQKIEVHRCSHSAAISVYKIAEQQRELSNEEFVVLISGMEK